MGRRLGQHCLFRRAILERIAEAVCPQREPLVIEVGPGKGALTEYLLARAERVVAIETDPLLVERLAEKFSQAGTLTLIRADVLKTGLEQWGEAIVAGNLPYYITSPILRKVLALGPRLRHAVFLVQKEVAERLTARPGSRQYGFLTVETQLFAVPEILFPVPPSAFRPPPKVDSAVVRLRPHRADEQAVTNNAAAFLEFVGLCFRQKRKIIRNNLIGRYAKALLEQHPKTALRAEQLSIPELAELHRSLQGRSIAGRRAAPCGWRRLSRIHAGAP